MLYYFQYNFPNVFARKKYIIVAILIGNALLILSLYLNYPLKRHLKKDAFLFYFFSKPNVNPCFTFSISSGTMS